MPNTARSDAATYERVLLAATEVFAQKGYSGTSVREIVAVAGVTKPVLYYYFRSKEGIYLELFHEPFAKLAACLDEVSNGRGSATKRLKKFCCRLHFLFCEHVELLNLLCEIIQAAREESADLIVMGAHGRTGLDHLILGSTAENVVRKSPCPVLTVRLPGKKFIMP